MCEHLQASSAVNDTYLFNACTPCSSRTLIIYMRQEPWISQVSYAHERCVHPTPRQQAADSSIDNVKTSKTKG